MRTHDVKEILIDKTAIATVLLVNDILDSGRTLDFTKKPIIDRGAKSVQSCVLLDKKTNRAVELEADEKALKSTPFS